MVCRMPLALVWCVVEEHFVTTPPLSCYKMAEKFGLSPTAGGPLHSLLTLLLKQEARCADDFQQTCVVGG